MISIFIVIWGNEKIECLLEKKLFISKTVSLTHALRGFYSEDNNQSASTSKEHEFNSRL
jgi:hypothetical protein